MFMLRLTHSLLVVLLSGLVACLGCQAGGAQGRIRDEAVDRQLTQPQPPAPPPATPSPDPRPEFPQEPSGQ